MTKRPHDAIFKWGFEDPAAAAALLRELVPAAIRDAIDWSSLRSEPGAFIDRVLADRHNDLLFSALLRTGEPRRVFLLLEHQSTSDSDLPRRVLSYQAQIWERFRKEHPAAPLPPVLAVLVSHVPGGWTAPRSLDELFDPSVLALPGLAALVPRFSMLALDLAHQSNADLAARALPAPQQLVLWLLRDARNPPRLLANFEAWRPALVETGRGRAGLDRLAVLIEYMFRVVDRLTWDALHAKLRTLGTSTEDIAMTIAEHLHAEGLAEGLEKGLERGRSEGRLDTLRRQLVLKFQALDAAAEARLQAATAEAIDRYLERVLTADSLAAVLGD